MLFFCSPLICAKLSEKPSGTKMGSERGVSGKAETARVGGKEWRSRSSVESRGHSYRADRVTAPGDPHDPPVPVGLGSMVATLLSGLGYILLYPDHNPH